MADPKVNYAVGFVLTLLLLGFLRRVAMHIGLVDRPDSRKHHVGQVPLIGGVAMFCGFMLAALMLDQSLTAYRSFFAAAGILVVVGILDDLREMTSAARFAAQIVAAGLMAWWGGIALHDLGGLRAGEGLFELGAWAIPFTIFATVGVINALNMIDGLDGLAGGLCLITLLALAYIAHDAGLHERRGILLLLASCVAAFLVLNIQLPGRSQAYVFMGDAGSMFLGFVITWFFIDMSQQPVRAMTPVTALWLMLIPLFDTVWLLIKRPLTGRIPTSADKEHIHHVLRMAGISPGRTLCWLLGIGAGFAVLGIVMMKAGVPQNYLFWAFIGVFVLYCVLMAIIWWQQRFFGRPLDRRLSMGDRRTVPDRRISDRRSGTDRRLQLDRRGAGARDFTGEGENAGERVSADRPDGRD